MNIELCFTELALYRVDKRPESVVENCESKHKPHRDCATVFVRCTEPHLERVYSEGSTLGPYTILTLRAVRVRETESRCLWRGRRLAVRAPIQ